MSLLHWDANNRNACGVDGERTLYAYDVTCRSCLSTEPTKPAVIDRLAELDREQAPAMTASTTPPTFKMADGPFKFTLDGMDFSTSLIKSISYGSEKPKPDHSALLLRAASFLADLPSGSLDRVRNVEAMNLIRALRDAVVPADKVRK